jgi:hypothetical protein
MSARWFFDILPNKKNIYNMENTPGLFSVAAKLVINPGSDCMGARR